MSALDDAINSPSPVWLTPKVQTDWAKNGYDGDNTVDDLSEQLGDAFTVSHSIEDALPEPVTSTGQNDASGTLSAPDMVGKTVNGVPFDARQYFSPFNTASPVYGYDRDVAPVTLDFGTLTSAGPDYRRLFTGQMANVAISGRLAELDGQSAARMKMTASAKLPVLRARTAGLNMGWPLSYALASAGVYVSPPPSQYTRYWAPLHGSLAPVLGSNPNWDPSPFFQNRLYNATDGGGTQQATYPPCDEGPFYLCMAGRAATNDAVQIGTMFRPQMNDGRPDVLSQSNSKGRFSVWLRSDQRAWTYPNPLYNIGDAFSFNMGNQTTTDYSASDVGIHLAVRMSDLQVYMEFRDTHNLTTWNTGVFLPQDNLWHYLAWTYDFAGGQMKVYLDGVETTRAGTATTDPTLLMISEAWYNARYGPASSGATAANDAMTAQWYSTMPTAEACWEATPLFFTGGGPAYRDVIPFTPGAVLPVLSQKLEALTESAPRDAWSILVDVCQSTLSMYRVDENDVVQVLGLQDLGDRRTFSLADSFTRLNSGTWDSTWTIPSGASQFSVDGSRGCIDIAANTTLYNAFQSGSTPLDYDVTVLLDPQTAPTGGSLQMQVVGRYVDATHYVYHTARFDITGNTITLFLIGRYGGSEVALDSAVALPEYVAGRTYLLRARAQGAGLYAKLWQTGTVEPEAWIAVATDTAPVAGSLGLSVYANSGNTNTKPYRVRFDDFTWSSLDATVADTNYNAQDIDAQLDPTKIRNDVTIQYTDTSANKSTSFVYQSSDNLTLLKGKTVVTVTLDSPVAEFLHNRDIIQGFSTLFGYFSAWSGSGAMTPSRHWMTVNSKSDGTGSYLTSGVTASLIAFDGANLDIEFMNSTGKTVYLANNSNLPTFQVAGYGVKAKDAYSSARDTASIALRGSRSLSSEVLFTQRRSEALSLAQLLVAAKARPVGEIKLTVMGDPRRKPGDVISVADSQGTGAAGLWRVLAVEHNRSSAQYTQNLTCIQVGPTGLWGTGLWDLATWGI